MNACLSQLFVSLVLPFLFFINPNHGLPSETCSVDCPNPNPNLLAVNITYRADLPDSEEYSITQYIRIYKWTGNQITSEYHAKCNILTEFSGLYTILSPQVIESSVRVVMETDMIYRQRLDANKNTTRESRSSLNFVVPKGDSYTEHQSVLMEDLKHTLKSRGRREVVAGIRSVLRKRASKYKNSIRELVLIIKTLVRDPSNDDLCDEGDDFGSVIRCVSHYLTLKNNQEHVKIIMTFLAEYLTLTVKYLEEEELLKMRIRP
ncbi:MAG: hypothetical protein FuRV4_gp3 [Hangzhou rhabdovirus 4]|uniref:Uncharacterized protein n=1 Tax=Hangzhou rhabdovirus 4 TaxID=2905393 RepID=A0A8K1XCC9_9RHAB|nr:MAG: hypothetical protein FuRV4_gp3 [Hangzhou rhabdovirus 4]